VSKCPSYFVCFRPNLFPPPRTVSICKSTHNSAKTYRTGSVFSVCIPAFLLLSSYSLPFLPLSSHSVDPKCRLAPLRRWKSQKIPRPRQNYDRVCIEKETVAVELLQSIFSCGRHIDRTFFFFQLCTICYQLYFPCTKIGERVRSSEWYTTFSLSWKTKMIDIILE